jgi:cytochrome c nitrite reductase small subunit
MTRSAGLIVAVVGAVGFVAGLGGYTFQKAEGHSYLSDDPAACMNCHVMREQFEGWNHSSHRSWATCNDCHTPTGSFAKWWTKALNGWNHSVKFTTMAFDEPIRINETNRRIAVNRCLDCHGAIVAAMDVHRDDPEGARCLHCHGNPGHQTRN